MAESILSLIGEQGAPVRSLVRLYSCGYFDYFGPEELLLNCNTPKQFATIRKTAAEWPSCL